MTSSSGMLRLNNTGKAIPSWLICDRVFVHNYGLGVIPPVWQRLSYWEKRLPSTRHDHR